MPLSRKSENRVRSVVDGRHNSEQRASMVLDEKLDREQIHDRWHVKRILSEDGEKYYWELSGTNGEVIARIHVNLLLNPDASSTK
jgi:hypothetical protein